MWVGAGQRADDGAARRADAQGGDPQPAARQQPRAARGPRPHRADLARCGDQSMRHLLNG